MCMSCAPIPVRYYYLESNSGEAIYSSCFINEDIPNSIRFSQQGIQIYSALEKLKGKKYIVIHIEIPEGKIVKLKSAAVQVFWSDNNQLDKTAFRKINLTDKILMLNPATQEHILDTDEPMVGKKIKSELGEGVSITHWQPIWAYQRSMNFALFYLNL